MTKIKFIEQFVEVEVALLINPKIHHLKFTCKVVHLLIFNFFISIFVWRGDGFFKKVNDNLGV